MTDSKDWINAWEEGRTRWHRQSYSSSLISFADRLDLAKGDTLFFPLCGATLDMKWALEKGFKVIGVELSSIAIEQFFTENNLNFVKQSEIYQAENIRIYQKNIFDLQSEDLCTVSAIYDRAAMVALDEETRLKYLQLLSTICPKGIRSLLEVFEYDQKLKEGPPYSVSKQELEKNCGLTNLNISELRTKVPTESFAELDKIETRVYLVNFPQS